MFSCFLFLFYSFIFDVIFFILFSSLLFIYQMYFFFLEYFVCSICSHWTWYSHLSFFLVTNDAKHHLGSSWFPSWMSYIFSLDILFFFILLMLECWCWFLNSFGNFHLQNLDGLKILSLNFPEVHQMRCS